MEAWSVNQVCRWLVEENLGELVHRFQEEEVSGAALLALNDRMVQQLVKKIGHQAVLMDLIKKYKQKSQGLKSPGSSGEAAPVTQAAAAPEFTYVPQDHFRHSDLAFPHSETVCKQWEGKKLFQTAQSSFPALLDGLDFELKFSSVDWTLHMALARPRRKQTALFPLQNRDGQASSPANHGEQMRTFHPPENLDNGLVDPRVLKQRRHGNRVLAGSEALHWTKPYALPELPYDVSCTLAERKCPDHSVRIRIIEFLQADLTKYLKGSLYPTTQQYNDAVSALLQAHPFLDEDGCGFFLWKRALKDRFKYVRRPIEDDEQVMRNKCKFGHRRGQKRKSLADIRFDEIKTVQIKEEGICFGAEIDEHISWLQQEYVKMERDWREIDKRMSQTWQIRRKLIGNRTPVKDILKMFPFLKCPYQMFREFQVLTRTDIYKKTRHILESYSENILTSFPVVNNPINVTLQEKMKQHTDEDTLKYMKMTATCLVLPDVFGDDPSLFVIVNEKVQVSTPVLEVKNPFDIDVCEFSLYVEKERLSKVDDCVTALAVLVAAFHVFGIQCPRRLSQTLNFLETLIFDMHSPYFPSMKEKEKEVGFQHSVT